jgi:hypothetical protein
MGCGLTWIRPQWVASLESGRRPLITRKTQSVIRLMESVSYPTSGALNRAHYALVAKIENAASSSEVESAILSAIDEIRQRVLRGSGSAFGRLRDLAGNWGVHLPTAPVWDPVSEHYSAIPPHNIVLIHRSTSHFLV